MTNAIPQRSLGSSGIAVSAVGLGCMSLSGVYGASSDDDGISVIHEALDRGITFLDTSDMYGFGHNEELVGRAIKGRRAGVVLATKFGNLGGRGGKVADGRPEYVVASCEASLKRLGVEVIDLYYQHRVDPNVPIEDVANTVKDLIKAGKVLHFGLSEASGKTIRRAHGVLPVTAIQTEYSLMQRDPEKNGVLATCEELGIGFVPWGPVGQGYLTRKIDTETTFDAQQDMRAGFPRFSAENIAANAPIVDLLKRIAEKKKATAAQISLSWLLAQKPWIVPIPGTSKIDHLNENLGAINVQLTPADLREIETALSEITVHGGRMNEEQMKVVDQTA
jgi:aryl-alcohol dehydrogenase-like predicted oxidoreductase